MTRLEAIRTILRGRENTSLREAARSALRSTSCADCERLHASSAWLLARVEELRQALLGIALDDREAAEMVAFCDWGPICPHECCNTARAALKRLREEA